MIRLELAALAVVVVATLVAVLGRRHLKAENRFLREKIDQLADALRSFRGDE